MIDYGRRATERAGDLGLLGKYLLLRLPPGVSDAWPESLVAQAVRVKRLELQRVDEISVVACVVLLCDAVIQYKVSDEICINLFKESIKQLPDVVPQRLHLGKKIRKKTADGSRAKPGSLSVYRGGSMVTKAMKKANLRFGDVYRDTGDVAPDIAEDYRRLSGFTSDFTDSQAASALIVAVAWQRFESESVKLAIRCIRDPAGCKAASTVFKSLGLNHTAIGAMLCEANCLVGRGVGDIDLAEEVEKRVGESGAALPMPRISDDVLRTAVRKIFEREIGENEVLYESPDEFWSKRWLWCVNGSHSKAIGRKLPHLDVDMPGVVHRRVALEQWTENPLDFWDGQVLVSASKKYEHGKTRLIMACDTLSYVCFEHLLRPVEKQWKNKVTLLDPGSMGNTGVSERVNRLRRGHGAWLMLDYDDFNSQHTLSAQKIVVEELVKYVGYDENLGRRLVDSFDNMVASAPAMTGTVTSTLMSGHRGTTFINSVLNEAYIAASYKGDLGSLPRLHTGDDVVMFAGSLGVVERLLGDCKESGLRLNDLKQSVGHVGAEFLRMAITDEVVRGYLCRSVASAVSGNWVNPRSLDGMEHVRTMITNAHTLSLRGCSERVHRLMVTAFVRKVGCQRRKAEALLSRRVALEGGPCFQRGGVYVYYPCSGGPSEVRRRTLKSYTHRATISYLSEHVTKDEIDLLEGSGVSALENMIDSSYGKTLSEAETEESGQVVVIHEQRRARARGVEDDFRVWRKVRKRGLLEGLTVVQLVKNELDHDVLCDKLRELGWDGTGTAYEAAWGRRSEGAVFDGPIPYSDASHLCNLAVTGVIHVTRPVLV